VLEVCIGVVFNILIRTYVSTSVKKSYVQNINV
jgi:hypothetical protein